MGCTNLLRLLSLGLILLSGLAQAGTAEITPAGGLTSGSASTLQEAFAGAKEITGANSLLNALRVGDGVTPWCFYTDASDGPVIKACTDADSSIRIETNKNFYIRDVEAAANVETIDPDAASTHAMYSYGTAYKPLKEVVLSAGAWFGDGTQCPSDPTTVQLGSGERTGTFICADNDASTLYTSIAMPNAWDGGTLLLTGFFVQTAADTNNLNADVAMACRANTDALNNTWGTEIAMDTAMSGSSAVNSVTTTAITPNGTCTADNTILQIRWQMDATGTTTAVATLHMYKFKLSYREDSRSS